MSRIDFLNVLRLSLADYSALLDDVSEAELAAPVPSCGEWTVYDLTDHLGRGNLWVATAVREQHGGGGGDEFTAPRDADALRGWFLDANDTILGALDTDPDTEAWTFTSSMPRNVGFWQRRRAHETAMHLWDARDAFGKALPIHADLAADGIDEVFELFAPRMVQRGLAAEPAVAVRVTVPDEDCSWTYGPGEPVAEISGAASDVLLLLWGRIGPDDEAVTVTGDRAAAVRMLNAPLVP